MNDDVFSVDFVDQLTEPAGVSSIEMERQSSVVAKVFFVLLEWMQVDSIDRSAFEDV